MGADEFEIITEKAYPTEYQPCTGVAKAENEANARSAIKGKVENMEQNAQGMESKTAKIDKWLGEIGF